MGEMKMTEEIGKEIIKAIERLGLTISLSTIAFMIMGLAIVLLAIKGL